MSNDDKETAFLAILARSRTGMIALLTLFFFAGALPGFAAGKSDSPNRIVSVGGSLTEIVYALGQEDRLVARDTTSTFPADAAALPDVGYIRRLSPEGVLSVNPDHILMLEGSGPAETLQLLEATGVPITKVPEAFTPEGILEKIRTTGAALGVPEKAERLAKKVQGELDTAHNAAAARSHEVRVLFLLSIQGGRLLAAGKGTAAEGIITLAGARNAIDGFNGYKQLSEEAALKANPDVVLMMNRGGDHGAKEEEVFAHPAIALTPAGINKRLVQMNGLLLLGFGPRTAEAVAQLSDRIDAFSYDGTQ